MNHKPSEMPSLWPSNLDGDFDYDGQFVVHANSGADSISAMDAYLFDGKLKLHPDVFWLTGP